MREKLNSEQTKKARGVEEEDMDNYQIQRSQSIDNKAAEKSVMASQKINMYLNPSNRFLIKRQKTESRYSQKISHRMAFNKHPDRSKHHNISANH